MHDTHLKYPFEPEVWDGLKKEIDGIPHLKEKMLVDLVNGLEVSAAQILYQGEQGFLSRIFGYFSGSNHRREKIIRQQTQRSLEALTAWAMDMTKDVSATHRAVERVALFARQSRDDLLKVAQTVLQQRSAINAIENRLDLMEDRLNHILADLDARLHGLEIRQHITEVTEGWRSGRICGAFPPAIGAIFIIDSLLRGSIGGAILNDQKATIYLKDRVLNTLHEKLQLSKTLQPLDRFWFSACLQLPSPENELVAYGVKPIIEKSYLRLSVSEYLEKTVPPVWLENIQQEGNLPVLLDAEIWTDCLVREAKDHLQSEVLS